MIFEFLYHWTNLYNLLVNFATSFVSSPSLTDRSYKYTLIRLNF